MSQIRVGVLRGGPSNEFEVSLKTGKSILDNLSEDFSVSDILIDKKGDWFLDGLIFNPHNSHKKVDIFFNCLHGNYGEDGKLQQLLDSLYIPYTGSGAYGSALAMNKFLAKRTFSLNDFKVPEHEVVGVGSDLNKKLREIFHTWFLPVIVKPVKSGSSVGVSLASNFQELQKACADAFEHSSEIMIEEYIRGREATCGVLEDFRNERLYALPVAELKIPQKANFYSQEVKYSGETEVVVPGRFSKEEKEEVQRLAKLAHKVLGLRHYSRSDFLVSKNGIYTLETNTLPGLTNASSYPMALEAIGSNLAEFSTHLINLALNKR